MTNGWVSEKRDDSRSERDRAGGCKISSQYSKRLTIEKLGIVYLQNFLFRELNPQKVKPQIRGDY